MQLRKLRFVVFVLLLFLQPTSAVPEISSIKFNNGDSFEYTVAVGNEYPIFYLLDASAGDHFTMTITSVPEENFRTTGFEISLGDEVEMNVGHPETYTDFFIYANVTYWREIGVYNNTLPDFSAIGNYTELSDTFTFHLVSTSSGLTTKWDYTYDYNGIIIEKKIYMNEDVIFQFNRLTNNPTIMSSSQNTPTTSSNTPTNKTSNTTDTPIASIWMLSLSIPFIRKYKQRN